MALPMQLFLCMRGIRAGFVPELEPLQVLVICTPVFI